MQQIRLRNALRRGFYIALSATAAFSIGVLPAAVSAATVHDEGREANAFAAAAREFSVPEDLLLATSYSLTRWESHQGAMSSDGGYGPMNLRATKAVEDGRGDPARPIPADKTLSGEATIERAARLLHVSTDTLKNDSATNIRGGAAVLADDAKAANGGQLPQNTSDWYAAVATYSGASDEATASDFADTVYTTLSDGQNASTTDGQSLHIAPRGTSATPNRDTIKRLGLRSVERRSSDGSECPRGLDCRFVSAGYAANSADPTDYGNYDHSNRPHDMQIKYIVIHDTEGSYASAISHFQDTSSYVSAHYVIRSSDGAITQMVATKDTAWHAGDWWLNMHSIGIEHEGAAAAGSSWYTEAMYHSSAELVRYLAQKYDIPLDRDHIIGHDNVPGLSDARVVANHWDPGPYWDWNHYMDLVQHKAPGANAREELRAFGNNKVVTISPNMASNVQTVQNCASDGTCETLTKPSNFVYLRTQPTASAPLIHDILLHPGGEPGTTRIEDWSAKATTGQQFALADRQGDWTALWYGGQKAWFYNPAQSPTATIGHGKTIQLKNGLASAPIYGGAYPEASVYPAGVYAPVQPQLSYTIKAGQQYVSDGVVPTDYFYDWTIDSSAPYDHQIFRGQDRFIKIWYNHRVMFVRASDVMYN